MTQKSGTIVSIFRRAHRCLPLLFVLVVLSCCALLFFGHASSRAPSRTSTVALKSDRTATPAIDKVRRPEMQKDSEVQLVGLLPALPDVDFEPGEANSKQPASQTEENLYWEFTVEVSADEVEVSADKTAEEAAELQSDSSPSETAASTEPFAFLLAPQPVPQEELENHEPEQQPTLTTEELALEFPPEANSGTDLPKVASSNEPEYVTTPTFSNPNDSLERDVESDLSINQSTKEFAEVVTEEQQLVALILRESTNATTGNLTNSRVNQLAIAKIAEANVLADRGATFAARQRLIEVLRLVSQSKDAAQGKREHSLALRSGLRALEEAEDFSPRGSQLEAELNIELVVDAHQTPVAEQLDLDRELPRQMVERYLRYAQIKLSMSVAGDPAGSMALYALGKVTSRMGKSEKLANPLAHQQAVAFQQAAVLSRSDNYFATHELAVLLAESGHLGQSLELLVGLANSHQNPTLFRNLARVQEQLGLPEQAAATRSMAIAMTSNNPQQSGRVHWVAPHQFGSSSVPSQYATPSNMVMKPTHDRRTAQVPISRNAVRTPHHLPPQQWR